MGKVRRFIGSRMQKSAGVLRILGLCAGLVWACLSAGCLFGGDVVQVEQQAEQHTESQTPESAVESQALESAVIESAVIESAVAGNPFILLNGNQPGFTAEELAAAAEDPEPYARYSELDEWGRCGSAVALLGAETMPAEPRGSIGNLKPTGWHTVKYNELIDDNYLYNRCHLIGYQLGGENADLRNLMTGTRYLNVEGMLLFENRVAQYLKDTGNHVLYRVTPVFTENNLLADGVIMEAESIEDSGEGVRFQVFVYNVQPGIRIDYATGESETDSVGATEPVEAAQEITYILNKSSGKFHLPACESVSEMAEHNKQRSMMSREELIAAGFTPCKICNP